MICFRLCARRGLLPCLAVARARRKFGSDRHRQWENHDSTGEAI